MLHSSGNLFGKRFDQQYNKEGPEGALCNRDDSVKHYNKYEHKRIKDLKALKNNNKITYSIARKPVLRCELKNTYQNIKAKDSKKCSYSNSKSSSSGLDPNSSLFRDSDLDEERQPTESKKINRLYQIVTDNIKKNKNQQNVAIANEPSGTKYSPPVVTVSPRGGKK